MRYIYLLIFALVFTMTMAYAWDNVRVQTSDGMEVNATNPLPVTFGTGNQIISGNLTVNSLVSTYNVGIGTTTASEMLDVDGNIYASGSITGATLRAGGTTGASRIDFDANAAYLESLGDGGIYLGDKAAVPQATLVLNRGTRRSDWPVDGSIYAEDIEVEGTLYLGNITTSNSAKLVMRSAGTGTFPLQVYASDGSALLGLYERSTGESEMYLYDESGNADIRFATRSTINSYFNVGNLGIGTAFPVTKLQIGAGTPTYADGTNSDVYIADEIEVDGTVYLGDGGAADRIVLDGGIYSTNQYRYFKVGTTCYRFNMVTAGAASTVTCASISM